MNERTRRQPQGGPRFRIYVAGSCLRNPGGPAGWGCVIADLCNKSVSRLSGGLQAADSMSNIRAEMVGVVEALKAIPEGSTVTIWTNASHIAKAINRGYSRGKNLDLWEAIDAQAVRHSIKWRSARLYNKHVESLEAQALAQRETHVMANGERKGLPAHA